MVRMLGKGLPHFLRVAPHPGRTVSNQTVVRLLLQRILEGLVALVLVVEGCDPAKALCLKSSLY